MVTGAALRRMLWIMRTLLTCLTLVAMLLPSAAFAGHETAGKQSVAPAQDQARDQARSDKVPEEACFGDSYESDNDINEGNRISVEEILRLIQRPNT